MSFLFGGAAPPAQAHAQLNPVRECRKRLSRGLRGLQQEHKSLLACERQDADLVREAAVRGDHASIRSHALQLSRTKARIRKNVAMQSRMVAMDRRFSDISSSTAMTESLRSATMAMRAVTGSNDLASIAQVIREFDKQNGVMDEHMGMVDEAIDTMAEEDGEEDEANETVERMLTEIGLDAEALFPKLATGQRQRRPVADVDAEVESRLARLKDPNG